MIPGRSCPLAYRYAPRVFARAPDHTADTVYVVGGVYGNLPALEAVLALAEREPRPPLLVFNGDFHWFDIDPDTFRVIDETVRGHVALRGNVETELAPDADEAGCGCAYPDYVSDEDVGRSNDIMRRLRATARQHSDLTTRLLALPMHLVLQVGGARVGVVHGDAESLAGWRFAHDSLHEPEHIDWLRQVCRDADLTGFASSHTCLPTLRTYTDGEATRIVVNNGAAGMPNFAGTQYGLVTRIAMTPAAEGLAQYGRIVDGVHFEALPVHYDAARFRETFLRDWPAGSPAHRSYFRRIERGPDYFAPHALGLVRAPSVCA